MGGGGCCLAWGRLSYFPQDFWEKLEQAVLLVGRGQLNWKGWEERGEEVGAEVMCSTLPHAPPFPAAALSSGGGSQTIYILVLQILVYYVPSALIEPGRREPET